MHILKSAVLCLCSHHHSAHIIVHDPIHQHYSHEHCNSLVSFPSFLPPHTIMDDFEAANRRAVAERFNDENVTKYSSLPLLDAESNIPRPA